jgi:hypothetical protein
MLYSDKMFIRLHVILFEDEGYDSLKRKHSIYELILKSKTYIDRDMSVFELIVT